MKNALTLKLLLCLIVTGSATALAVAKIIPGEQAVDLVKYVASATAIGLGLVGAAQVHASTGEGAMAKLMETIGDEFTKAVNEKPAEKPADTKAS